MDTPGAACPTQRFMPEERKCPEIFGTRQIAAKIGGPARID
jgi:hypothetical protein